MVHDWVIPAISFGRFGEDLVVPVELFITFQIKLLQFLEFKIFALFLIETATLGIQNAVLPFALVPRDFDAVMWLKKSAVVTIAVAFMTIGAVAFLSSTTSEVAVFPLFLSLAAAFLIAISLAAITTLVVVVAIQVAMFICKFLLCLGNS